MPRILDCSPTYTDTKLVHVVRLEVSADIDLDTLLAAVAAIEAQPAPPAPPAPEEPAA